MKLDSQQLVEEFGPKLVERLEARKSQIVEKAGGLPMRAAVKMAWPAFINEVPTLTETLVELMIWKFGDLTSEQMLEAFDSLKKSTHTRTDIPPITL